MVSRVRENDEGDGENGGGYGKNDEGDGENGERSGPRVSGGLSLPYHPSAINSRNTKCNIPPALK
ncbi:hypothetical protein GCM10007418_15570 [Halopseudomonas salina]|uniref:Uncharacterized protein n=1 Tax=Halopseudomonas salina TaxID=1323744 RepID=A0ABQ1PH33_9GAMM|nr:hypothetical protein GCM10007418_15570 [Halopseudomonas salina]